MAKSRRNQLELLKQLPQSIQHHSRVKQLSKNVWILVDLNGTANFHIHFYSSRIVRDLSEVVKPMLTALFTYSIITICTAMLISQMLVSEIKKVCYLLFDWFPLPDIHI